MILDHPWLITVLSWGALTGLGFAGLLVTREQTRQEKLSKRMTSIVSPHMRVHHLMAPAVARTPSARDQSLLTRIAGIFGFNPDKLDRCPIQWWLVLLITFALARGAASLGYDVVGSLAYVQIPITWVLLSRMTFNWFDKRFQDKLLNQFPDALALIVRAVRVGIPVLRAIRNVSRDAPAPTCDVFARLVNQISIGVALDDAVQEMAEHSGLSEYGFFATAISLQMQTGGGLSETLENLADVIRRRVALKARGLALASEARTSAAVLAALPVVSGTAIWSLNPDYIGMLFQPGMGRMLLSLAILSMGCGLLTMRTLIRRSLS